MPNTVPIILRRCLKVSVSDADLRDWINARVAAKFQRMNDVVIMEYFSRNVAGNTLKRVMRDNYGKDHK